LNLQPKVLPDLCGHCQKCLDKCPSEAFIEPHVLDSEKCISYLTLEYRGDFSKNTKIKEAANRRANWIAGCDLCQEACPFNLKPSKKETQTPLLGATHVQTWEQVYKETESEYKQRIKHSALSRIKWEQWKRNTNTLHSCEENKA
jgi:epoxyqueuosine reductase